MCITSTINCTVMPPSNLFLLICKHQTKPIYCHLCRSFQRQWLFTACDLYRTWNMCNNAVNNKVVNVLDICLCRGLLTSCLHACLPCLQASPAPSHLSGSSLREGPATSANLNPSETSQFCLSAPLVLKYNYLTAHLSGLSVLENSWSLPGDKRTNFIPCWTPYAPHFLEKVVTKLKMCIFSLHGAQIKKVTAEHIW